MECASACVPRSDFSGVRTTYTTTAPSRASREPHKSPTCKPSLYYGFVWSVGLWKALPASASFVLVRIDPASDSRLTRINDHSAPWRPSRALTCGPHVAGRLCWPCRHTHRYPAGASGSWRVALQCPRRCPAFCAPFVITRENFRRCRAPRASVSPHAKPPRPPWPFAAPGRYASQ